MKVGGRLVQVLVGAIVALPLAGAWTSAQAEEPQRLVVQRGVELNGPGGIPGISPYTVRGVREWVAPDGATVMAGYFCPNCADDNRQLIVHIAPGGALVSSTVLDAPADEFWAWDLMPDGRSLILIRWGTSSFTADLERRSLSGERLASMHLGTGTHYYGRWRLLGAAGDTLMLRTPLGDGDLIRVRVRDRSFFVETSFTPEPPPGLLIYRMYHAAPTQAGTVVLTSLIEPSYRGDTVRRAVLAYDHGGTLTRVEWIEMDSPDYWPRTTRLPDGDLLITHQDRRRVVVTRVDPRGAVLWTSISETSEQIVTHALNANRVWAITLESLSLVDVSTGWRVLWTQVQPANGRFFGGGRDGAVIRIVAADEIYSYERWTPPSQARTGYWMAGDDGRVFAFGAAEHFGDAQVAADDGVTAIVPLRGGRGYRIATASGVVQEMTAAGTSRLHEAPGLLAGEHVTTIANTASEAGFWLFTNRGRVLTWGDAEHFGDLEKLALNGEIVGSSATASGRGYLMVGADGGVFAFGDADFHGSLPQHVTRLNAPVVGIVTTSTGRGYWMVASDGGVFAFGDAGFVGAVPGVLPLGVRLAEPVNGLVASGNGYLMVATDGGIFDFSGQGFQGSLGAIDLDRPIAAVAPLIP